MNYYAKHARALAATRTRLGSPIITWRNRDWAIVPGSAVRRADLAEGGLQLNADFRFDVLVGTFSAVCDDITSATELKGLMLQTAIGYLGDSYKVESVNIRPGGLAVLVECNSLDQRA